MMSKAHEMYSAFKLGDIAQRMGLQIVEGDPEFNLMMGMGEHQLDPVCIFSGLWKRRR